MNLLVYHGVLAPRARWRSQVVRYARAILAHLGLAPGPDGPGPAPARSHRGQRVTPGGPAGRSERLLINDGAGARAAVCPAHAPLDDVPVAKAPSPGTAIKIAWCSALSQGDAGDSRGPLQVAAGERGGFNVSGSSWNRVGDFRHVLVVSQRGQHAGEDLESKVFFITEPVGAALEDANLVVQPLDEAEHDLVLRAAVGGDPLPVLLNQSVGNFSTLRRRAPDQRVPSP